jgi:O-6-methylguanine DNA methyltransferase
MGEENQHIIVDEAEDLANEFGALRLDAPPELTERVFDRFACADGPAGPCFVAFGVRGVRYVELASAINSEPTRFVAKYRQRFARPLTEVRTLPSPISVALRNGTTGAIEIDLSGTSPFERAVLLKAGEIERGETRPYGWIAAAIGQPRAVRAVGSALRRNPVPFLVPCHRVLRNDGTVGQYAYGASLKERILCDEGVDTEALRRMRLIGRYVGSATTMIYCLPGCRHARRITPQHLRGFDSVHDAHAAGLRPCQHCQPPSVENDG